MSPSSLTELVDVDREFAAIVDALTRRGFLAGAAGGAALLGLAACGESDSPAASTATGETPWTVEHKYGTTTIPRRPQRVVTLGYTDQEPALALGVRPVGVVDFWGERPYGKWPWEHELWDGKEPTVVGERDDYDLEKIVGLQPDLIVGLYSGMTKQDYAKLSDIAPTVAQPPGYADFAATWSVITEMMGRCLGREAEAKKLVAGLEARFAEVRRAHPEWSGKTVAVVEPMPAGRFAVFGAGDPKVQFMESLGFTIDPAVAKFAPGGDVATLSAERLDLLDVDQLVVLVDAGDPTERQVRANRLFTDLGVVTEGRTLFLPFGTNPPVGAAMAFNSALSIPFGIDHVVPALVAQAGSAG